MTRRIWASRTDKEYPTELFSELKAGRLRQGWGYDPSQDLRLIQKEEQSGADWWARLSNVQKEAYPHYRLLGDGDDSVHIGDIVLAPNLPEYGLFCLTEVVGEYSFSILASTKDHGHIRSIRLLTPRGVNPYSATVHASLRATLRTPLRMWNLTGYGDHVDAVLDAIRQGVDVLSAAPEGQRLDSAWRSARHLARETLYTELALQLDRAFQAAEWEFPIVEALKRLYPGAEVKWTGGPTEHGADAVIVIPNRFGGIGGDWLIVVQVKNYVGQIASNSLQQIAQAFDKYGKEGQVIGGVLATTADVAALDFEDARKALEASHRIPVRILLKGDLIALLADGFTLTNQ